MTDSDFECASSARTAADALRHHYANVVVPMWRNGGFNPDLRLPYDIYDVMPRAEPPRRYRAMACARQLFVFARENDKAHADMLFAALLERFGDTQHGGFFYSVDARGAPLETDKDLYTHAFVIFACAAYLERFRVAEAGRVIGATLEVIRSRFPADPENGLSCAAVSPDFTTARLGARQNPLMHLTEAYLAARHATGETRFDTALHALLPPIADTFLARDSNCILELPYRAPDNWIEPGHQFEWFYLSRHDEHPAFAHAGLDTRLRDAFRFAQRYGVDARTGGVAAALERDGTMRDDTQRIWAQTEYLRALACHPDPTQRAGLAEQIRRFGARHLHAAGWHECLAVTGALTRADMPSTTAYHLASAYAALP
ncbi:MAG: AGE family epimerase/isomerase [Janthinobacterium lividum]